MITNYDFNYSINDETQEEPLFIVDELGGEFDTDDYEFQQSILY